MEKRNVVEPGRTKPVAAFEDDAKQKKQASAFDASRELEDWALSKLAKAAEAAETAETPTKS